MCCEEKKHQYITTTNLDALFSSEFYTWCLNTKLTSFIHLDNSYLNLWKEIKRHFLNEVFLSLLHTELAAP